MTTLRQLLRMASTMHSASFSLGTTRTLTSCRPDAGRLVLCCRAVGKKANGILVADAVTLCVAVLLCLAAPAAQAESWANNRGGAVKPYTGRHFSQPR